MRRALHGPLHDGIGAVLVRVPSRQPALHRSRHVLPIFGPREMPADLVLRVTPHSGRLTVHAVLDETQKMCAFLVLLLHKSTPIRPRPSALETPHAFGPGAADGRLLPTRNATPTPVAVTMASSGPACERAGKETHS